MATIDFSNLTAVFDMNNASTADWASYVGHDTGPGGYYQWLSTGGHLITAHGAGTGGIGIALQPGSDLPQSGQIDSIEIDLFNNSPGSPDIVITGLSDGSYLSGADLTGLANDDGVNENSDFWDIVLAGDDTVITGVGNIYAVDFYGGAGTNTLNIFNPLNGGMTVDFSLINNSQFDRLSFRNPTSGVGVNGTVKMSAAEVLSFSQIEGGGSNLGIAGIPLIQTAVAVDSIGGFDFSGVVNVDGLVMFQVTGTSGNDTFVLPDSTGADERQRTSQVNAGSGNDTVTGNAGSDDFFGNDGNDTLNGGDGEDVLDGGRHNDTLNGGNDDDILIGGEGSDTLNGGAGNDVIWLDQAAQGVTQGGEVDQIDGGSGFDTLHLDIDAGVFLELLPDGSSATFYTTGAAQAVAVEFDLAGTATGIEQYVGSDFHDILAGAQNVGSRIQGGGGNDLITGAGLNASGFDVLDGQDGDDEIHGNGGYSDFLIGGDGNDIIHSGNISSGDSGQYSYLFGDEEIFVSGTAFVNLHLGVSMDTPVAPGGPIGNDTFYLESAGQHIAIGGGGDDSFHGSDGLADVMLGGIGEDSFYFGLAQYAWAWGGLDVDFFYGSVLDDWMNGGDGGDEFYGGDGNDTVSFSEVIGIDAWNTDTVGVTVNLTTGTGTGGFAQGDTYDSIENVEGSRFDDMLIGDGGSNTLLGNGGNDVIEGGSSADSLFGGANGAGGDTLSYASSAAGVTVNLGAGTASGGDAAGDTFSGFENLLGSTQADTLTGDGGANTLIGRGGEDRLYGGDQADNLYGEQGNDTLNGDNGDDRLFGGTQEDDLFGGAGNDALYGEAGFDKLYGGDGEDRLYGGDQADNLYGEQGNDTLNGDNGDDRLFGGTQEDDLFGGAGNDALYGEAGFDKLYGGDGEDRLYGGDQADNLYGEQGNDTLNGDNGDDRLFGGTQEDDLFGGAGNDALYGEAGFDKLYGGDGEDRLYGGDQADNLYGEQGNDTLNGDNGDDRLFGGTQEDDLFGGAGNDALYGEAGFDKLYGGNGEDRLYGGDQADHLYGEAGFDKLYGGAGDDTLTGGAQADTFIFSGTFGSDTITDFEATNDAEDIDLSGVASITDWTDLSTPANGHMYQSGADVIIDDLAGNTITLKNINIGDLDAADFIF